MAKRDHALRSYFDWLRYVIANIQLVILSF